MSNSFFDRFVQRIGALGRPRATDSSQLHVAVFGKHRGGTTISRTWA